MISTPPCDETVREGSGTYILSPFATFVTSDPTCSTMPAPSVPPTHGYSETKKPYSLIFQSTGFNAVATILTRTSLGPGVGMGRSMTFHWPCFSGTTKAFWVDIVLVEVGALSEGSGCGQGG